MTPDSPVLWRLHSRPVEAISLRLPLSIGRHPASGLRLPEDDISRLHAVIEEREGQLTLVDQGSRNGAYRHGRRVGVAKLFPGAVVRLGQTVLWLAPERTPRLHLEARLAEEASRATPLLLTVPSSPDDERRTSPFPRSTNRGPRRARGADCAADCAAAGARAGEPTHVHKGTLVDPFN